ncbi:MAG: 3-methyladenine DNA glycosylase [SAR86 cluster bacterium]|uniref:3-methyladenine DNA glycosylase n=1 Tax=SAR86 cluster bacterium TaxID=2030880 RepID=A0A2A5BBH8_9GAMM|nr:MAG: 3-methyladenine DNA glycosylase [SAR86 cluster bacterium]
MKKFNKIRERAEKRKGGATGLKKLLPKFATKKKLAAVGDDRYLAMMTKTINQAGFSWKVIENKWPEFEEAFFGFKLNKLSLLSPEQWEAYTSDRRVVRNWQKIKALQENVYFVMEESRKHGSFGKFLADWPASDQVGLMLYLKKNGSRLGGQSALWFMRRVEKDCFILSRDVVVALNGTGLDIAEKPSSQRDLKKIQEQFNSWHEKTGLPYSHLSRILACSVGENFL